MTVRTQQKQSNQSPLPQRDDCKPRNDTKYSITKQGPKHKPTINILIFRECLILWYKEYINALEKFYQIHIGTKTAIATSK